MRVGFDAHMLGQHETGNETYAIGLLAGLDSLGFAVDAYTFGARPAGIHRYHTIRPRQSAVRIPLVTPLVAARDKLDIFHATYILPPLLPCVGVVTVHDITYALFPEWFSPRVRATLRLLVPLALRQARRVIAISHNTRRDLVEHYGIPSEKIDVVYLAPRPAFSHRISPEPVDHPYFLYVGNVEPRKNVRTVIQAMALLRERGLSVRLVVAGKQGLHFDSTRALVATLGLADWVEFTGYVPDERLRSLYASALALVHPALYEGFGLTPLEAMVQHTPVIAAATSALPEVLGDAGLLVEALNVEEWAAAMQTLAEEPALREKYGARGAVYVQRFSWTRCAEQTVDVYRRALQ